jgi:hypothetical protein
MLAIVIAQRAHQFPKDPGAYSVQCLAGGRNARPRGGAGSLVGADAAHDEPAPARARKWISLPPRSTSFLPYSSRPHADFAFSSMRFN